MTKPEIFRPVSNLLLGFFVVLMAILFVLQAGVTGGLAEVVTSVFIAATAIAVSWLLFLRPRIIFNEDTLEIINPLRTIVVGYKQITDLDTKYGLTVKVADRKFSVWVAPAPSRYTSRGVNKQDVRGLGIEVAGTIRAADSPNSASGVAAYLLRTKMDGATETASSRTLELQVRFNSWGAAAAFVPFAAFVLAQLVIH